VTLFQYTTIRHSDRDVYGTPQIMIHTCTNIINIISVTWTNKPWFDLWQLFQTLTSNPEMLNGTQPGGDTYVYEVSIKLFYLKIHKTWEGIITDE